MSEKREKTAPISSSSSSSTSSTQDVQEVDLDSMPDAEPVQPIQLPSATRTVVLVDPEDRLGNDVVRLIRVLQTVDPPVRLTSTRPLRTERGFLLGGQRDHLQRVADHLAARKDLPGCAIHLPRTSPSVSEVTLRGLDAAFSDAEVLDELRHLLGQDAVRSVRRLHQRTGGEVDRSRPLPLVVAQIAGDEALWSLRQDDGSITLFGCLRVRVGLPRPRQTLPQCPRCFTWGHRAGACRAPVRCLRCGEAGHLRDKCGKTTPPPDAPKTCLECGGPHSVAYGGCPAHRRALDLLWGRPRPTRERPEPRQPEWREVSFRGHRRGVSYAGATRARGPSSTTRTPAGLTPHRTIWDSLPLESGPDTDAEAPAVDPAPLPQRPARIRRRSIQPARTDAGSPPTDLDLTPVVTDCQPGRRSTSTRAPEGRDAAPATLSPTDRSEAMRGYALRTRDIAEARARVARDLAILSAAPGHTTRKKTLRRRDRELQRQLEEVDSQRRALQAATHSRTVATGSPPTSTPEPARVTATSVATPTTTGRTPDRELLEQVRNTMADIRALIRCTTDPAAAVSVADRLIGFLLSLLDGRWTRSQCL